MESTKRKAKNQKRRKQQKRKVEQLKRVGTYKKPRREPAGPVAAIDPPGDHSDHSPPPEEKTQNPQFGKYTATILKLMEPTVLEEDIEVKMFLKTVLEIMKKEANYEEDEDAISKVQQTEKQCGKFFSLLEKKNLPKEMAQKILEIKTKLVLQEYNEANAVYLELAIGKTAWPSNAPDSNIIANEEIGSILPAIKRLMTFWEQVIAPKFVTLEQKEENEFKQGLRDKKLHLEKEKEQQQEQLS